MSIFIGIHKIALLITIVCGIVVIFQKLPIVKKVHKLFGIITVATIFLYLIQTSFRNVGYIIYTILLFCLFFTPERLIENKKILYHISVFIIAIICLITTHIV